MAFYINPPRGYMRLACLEALTWRRFHFLLDVASSGGSIVSMADIVKQVSTVEGSDGLIEGSQKDLVSHFMMRLACAQDADMNKFFIHAETCLFAYRFSCLTEDELLSCIKPLRRLMRKIKHENSEQLADELSSVVSIVSQITRNCDWKDLMQSYMIGESSTFVTVPFYHVLDLVRKRIVILSNGQAHVPISKLADIMLTLFSLLLKHGCETARQMVSTIAESDLRINRLLKSLKAYFFKNRIRARTMSHPGSLCCEDIEDVVEQFPLCMRNLHFKLQKKHLLRHFSRIQYTLFLKEVGLPFHEALEFWRREYSRAPSRVSSTIGSRWHSEAKRYTYSIRHLYGLEGSRVNYRGHCCNSLQDQVLGHGEEGGCPFKHSDKQHLLQEILSADLPIDAAYNIMNLSIGKQQYNAACQLFMRAKFESTHGTIHKSKLKKDKAPTENVLTLEGGRFCSSQVQTAGTSMSSCRCTDQFHQTTSLESLPLHDISSGRLGISQHSNGSYRSAPVSRTMDESIKRPVPNYLSANHENCCKVQPSIRTSLCDSEQSSHDVVSHSFLSLNRPSCFEHKTCPHKQEDRCYPHSIDRSVEVCKPIDYYLTYKRLLGGLQ